jgi:hypothetical protein
MKNRLSFALTLSLLLSSSTLSLAAASPEEAARLKALFETYLTNEAGVVTVTPADESYDVKLDFKPLLAKAKDVTVEMSPFEFSLTPSDEEGEWDFESEAPLNFKLTGPSELSIEATATMKSSGIFSEEMNAFASSEAEYSDLTFKQSSNDPTQGKMDITYSVGKWSVKQTTEQADEGTLDSSAESTLENLSETVNVAGAMPMNLVISAESATYDTVSTGLKAKPLYDFAAFFVAHPNKDSIVKDQSILKGIMKEALPIFANTSSAGVAANIKIDSPIGPITIAEIETSSDMNGVVKEGKFGQKITMTGLKLPDGIVPPWASSVTPSAFTFDYALSGFDLATVADMALAKLDLAKDPPLPAGFENKLLPAIMPTGAITFRLNPTTVDSAAANLAMDGVISYGGGPMPTGSGLVSVKGFDEVVKAVSAAPPEMGLQSAVAGMLFVKGMGKAEDGGKLSWKIETTPEGGFLVNGLDPMKMAPAQ